MILDNEFAGDLRVENEVTALQLAGHQVFVLCLNYGKKEKSEVFNGAKIIRIPLSKKIKDKLRFLNNTVFDIYSLFWASKIKSFATTNNIDVLHAHDLYMAESVIQANKKLKLATVLDLHENYPATLISYSWAKSFLGRLLVSSERWVKKERRYLPQFSNTILLSEQFRDVLSDRYPNIKDKFHIYPNYPNVEKLMSFNVDEKILDTENSFIIFYFGAIAERRGVFTLLEALRILLKKSKSYKVLIIGPVDNADKPRLNNYLSEEELKDNIIQYNWKDAKYLPSYINASDVCTSPLIKNDQHESGIANKVFQYMLFEKPLIVSNCYPQQKVVEEENCGLVFESENASDLADKIEILYNDEILRKEMGINGKKAVLAKYNYEKASNNLVAMYKNIESRIES